MRTNGRFREASFEEALALVAERLGAVRAEHGPDAVATYLGHPNAHDYAQLETIYAHTDSTTTVGASAGFLPDAVPSLAPANQVNRSTYRADLGDGRSLVTHIYWID